MFWNACVEHIIFIFIELHRDLSSTLRGRRHFFRLFEHANRRWMRNSESGMRRSKSSISRVEARSNDFHRHRFSGKFLFRGIPDRWSARCKRSSGISRSRTDSNWILRYSEKLHRFHSYLAFHPDLQFFTIVLNVLEVPRQLRNYVSHRMTCETQTPTSTDQFYYWPIAIKQNRTMGCE